MRATLDIDGDILRAAKALADAESKSLGQVLSELVRKGLAEAATAPGLVGGVGLTRPAGEADQKHAGRRRR